MSDDLLTETANRLFAATCTTEVVEAAERDGWCATVWDAVAEAGFPWVGVPEDSGGSGGSFEDAAALLRAAGRAAAPIPLAETGVLGGWLLASAGLELPDGPVAVVPGPVQLGQAATVAWGRAAERIVGLVDDGGTTLVVAARADQVEVDPGRNLAGEPRDDVRITARLGELDAAPAPDGVDAAALWRRGALTRVVMAAGALEAMTDLTVEYTHQRRQFGKPVATFQAVQQHLVTVAQATARLAMAADVACRAVARGDGELQVAAAKILLDDAVEQATRSAHQAHGAMGVTREYPLHHVSRRLWAWRHEYGGARSWRAALGTTLVDRGADELFLAVTG